MDEILEGLAPHVGADTARRRPEEGTTFEASCCTAPLALEHLTGSWERAVRFFGQWDADVQLRWTTKYADVERSSRSRTPAARACASRSTRRR